MSFYWFKKRWGATLLALGSLVVVAAVACGSDDPATSVAQATNTPVATTVNPTAQPTQSGGGLAPTSTPRPTPTSAATAAPTAAGGGPSGSLVRAFGDLRGIFGIAYTGPYHGGATGSLGGIEETFFSYENGDPMSPELVDTWNIAQDGSKVTFVFKRGIPYNAPHGLENMDFGELNAHEVAEWFNRGNSTTNPDSTYPDGGDLAAIFLDATEVDEYTLDVALVTPVFFCLPLSSFGCLGAARGPHLVTHADTMGVEWARAHHIGTGAFVHDANNCISGDRCTIYAVENHWRQTADVAQITGIQVPESQTQIAMLKNGSVDLATVAFQLTADTVADPNLRFIETMPGGFVGQSILFSGNLWEEFHARTGEALNPWESPALAQDYPWLGDPWQQLKPANVKYTDTNNPAGMTDMEQARLVRLALSIAINRGEINEVLLSGLGTPIYSEYMGPEYPGWDPDRQTGVWDVDGNKISASGTAQSVQYELDDADLTAAGNLLTTAGFPLVNGVRQGFGTFTLQTYPTCEAGPVCLEVADAIMSDWGRMGLQVEGLVEDYAGVISPRMRDRVQFWPVLKNGDVHSNVYPLDWPPPPVDSSSSRPGWGVGFESKATAFWLFEILGERDKATREALHMDLVDYSMYWVQYAGVFQIPKGIIGNNRIKSWDGRQQHYSNVTGYPEYIVLNR